MKKAGVTATSNTNLKRELKRGLMRPVLGLIG